ncbi:MAG: glycosyltransferase family 87 protein [Candidatus Magasanikbacteria bacterium]
MISTQKYNFILLIVVAFMSFAVVASMAAYNNDPLKNIRYYYNVEKTENIFGSDFNANYFAAKKYFSRDSLYFSDQTTRQFSDELAAGSNRTRFVYYPFSAFFFTPLALLSFGHAFFLLTLLNIFLLIMVILFLSRFVANQQRYFSVFSFLFLFSPVVWSILERGQTDIIILFFLALCFVFFTKGKSKLSGFFLALASLFKITTLFLLPYFYFKDKKVFLSSIISFTVISLITGANKIFGFVDSLLTFSSYHSTSYLNTGIFGLFYNRIASVFIDVKFAHFVYLLAIIPVVILFIFYFTRVINKKGNNLASLAEFGFFLAVMLMLPTVSWIQHSIHLVFIVTAYWVFREKMTVSKKMVVMDVLLLLILSEPLLLLKFQEIPFSIIFALRPLYIILFLITFYFTFLNNKNENSLYRK